MKVQTKTIRQSVTLRATPHQVFEALLDSRTHGRLTGGGARISRRVGGQFSVFFGWATGHNLQLVRDRRIVQAWRANEAGWPKDHYSRVTFALRPVRGGTRLTFTQSGVPAARYADLQRGWRDYYWQPLREMFGG